MKTYLPKLLILIAFVIGCLNLQAQGTKKEYVSIEVYTGEEPGAGTDKHITLRLWADDKLNYVDAMSIIDLTKYVDGNAFERGSRDKFNYLLPPFRKLNKMTVSVNNRTIGSSKWYLKKIVIRQASGGSHIFECNCWIKSSAGTNGKVTLTPKTKDHKMEFSSFHMGVEVHTGDRRGAGTNANVYLTLSTESGDGAPIKLNSKIKGNAFESDSVDKLTVLQSTFQQLNSINIRHDNKGVGAGWYLDEIRITMPSHDVKIFDCNCWMEGSENGRTLYPRN